MTFLPIVERELRVAARKRATYWTRVIAAGLAIVLMGSFLGVWSATKQFFGGNSGQILFSILKWLCLAFACSAGLFLTSDCLSEEKRDGTLGLLFLTDLCGYDVVVGKLLATSLRSFYGLLAIFPVLGLTLMLGGVSGSEFFRTMLALCNALFFSLAAGVFISAISRDALKAMSATLLLCAVSLGIPPLLDLWRADWDESKFEALWTMASPAYAFIIAPQASAGDFWPAIVWPHGLGWVWLVLASVAVPRSWQEKSTVVRAKRISTPRRWRFGARHWRLKWLERNPLVWLAGRDLWVTRCARVVVFGAAGLAAFLYLAMESNGFYGVMSMIHGLLVLALYLWVAAQASRFLVEARRNGALELVLCTPITVAQIVRGQWAALQRMFVIPAAVILVMQVAVALLQSQMFARMNPKAVASPGGGGMNMETYQLIAGITGAVVFFTGLFALSWFGMWMGMTTRKASVAVVKTLAFVTILPWLGATILQILIISVAFRASLPYWSHLVFSSGIYLAKDLFFILWSRHELHTAFREAATRSDDVMRAAKPPPLPAFVRAA